MEKRDKLYEGKAKIVYATSRPGTVIQYFKDDATAFNALKRGTIVGKGVVNNRMSAVLFERLARAGIPTHYLRTLSDREMLCRRLDIIKIETIVRNVVAGSLAKRTGLDEGTAIKSPIVELYLKSDPLGDPMINEDHVRMLKLATRAEDQHDYHRARMFWDVQVRWYRRADDVDGEGRAKLALATTFETEADRALQRPGPQNMFVSMHLEQAVLALRRAGGPQRMRDAPMRLDRTGRERQRLDGPRELFAVGM